MSVKTEIKDGLGTSRLAGVTPAHALTTVQIPETARGLPAETVANLQVLIEQFTDSTGSSSQVVDGSVTPVEFTIAEEDGFTKWVTGFRLVIIGPGFDISSNQIRNYGNTGGGLTNGIDIEVRQSGTIIPVVLTPVQTAADYFPYQAGFLNLVGAITAADDLLNLDFTFDKPIVIPDGSDDRLVIRINDNITAALNTADSQQFAIAKGYKETS